MSALQSPRGARPRSGSLSRRGSGSKNSIMEPGSPRGSDMSGSIRSVTTLPGSKASSPVASPRMSAAAGPKIVRKSPSRPAAGFSSPTAAPKEPPAAVPSSPAGSPKAAVRRNGYGTPLQADRMQQETPQVETVAAKLARKRWQLATRMVTVCNDVMGPRGPPRDRLGIAASLRDPAQQGEEGDDYDEGSLGDDGNTSATASPSHTAEGSSPTGAAARKMRAAVAESDCTASSANGSGSSAPVTPGEAPLAGQKDGGVEEEEGCVEGVEVAESEGGAESEHGSLGRSGTMPNVRRVDSGIPGANSRSASCYASMLNISCMHCALRGLTRCIH